MPPKDHNPDELLAEIRLASLKTVYEEHPYLRRYVEYAFERVFERDADIRFTAINDRARAAVSRINMSVPLPKGYEWDVSCHAEWVRLLKAHIYVCDHRGWSYAGEAATPFTATIRVDLSY